MNKAVDQIQLLRDELKKFNLIDLKRLQARSLEEPEFPRMKYGFFPGGNGLFQGIDAKTFPTIRTLFLGSNYGCVSGFIDDKRELWTTDERNGPTWQGLRYLLCKSGINREECFFTNAWPFLHFIPEDRKRKGGGPPIDPCKPGGKESNLNAPIDLWRRDNQFMQHCIDYFKLTLRIVKPSLIVALGKAPALFLGDVWPNELQQWNVERTTRLIDVKFEQLSKNRSGVMQLNGNPLNCYLISHPSAPQNAEEMNGKCKGLCAESLRLIEAARSAGIMTN